MTSPDDRLRQSFRAPPEAYDSLMGRYLPTLAPAFADAAGVVAGQRVLDVGCGPGGLTRELVHRVGPDRVAAIDPSEPFVDACRRRNPGVDVRVGVGEDLPFVDAAFDATLACLVVGFLSDARAGAAQMVRVTVPGGVVAACFWDTRRMESMLRFWGAVADVLPGHPGEAPLLGREDGELADLLAGAGLADVRQSVLRATADYAGFDDWWGSVTRGVGPMGVFHAGLDEDARRALREACVRRSGSVDEPFTLTGHAWCAVGRRPA